ncbi:membrane protein insertase YidC [Evansella cellulosilytica]|uniref:Membrane protein insertase YidC n=1 Tax=Evansella cellulosilytica (strain ATCC 21833 / DSM 2522 / FERM P-1141 / JCM 9156 / N-4) TaxID=649639 RepID=E6TY89_EVAC2|nr:membrane protein insertase YidC [Evansella cellulosilytica]ADU32408.1 membrane protein insertase, YidC/Oxa1 family [Evansella cellulosilytica DSM 2522]
MENKSVFKFFKRYGIFILIAFLAITLSGCGATNEPIDENTAGFFNHYVVYPFSYLIKFFAAMFNGNYGASIILMTILLRMALMPLMLKQYKNQIVMKEKMSVIQPEMQKINEQYKDKKDQESQRKKQQELMAVYQKHNFNPIASMGCLPMIIQLPILMGFYWAIMRTPEIASHSFLWFNLGETDLILPFLAAFVYFVQFKVSQIGVIPQPGQENMMKMMGFITPVMMGVFSFGMAAALPLYWTIGGLFLIFQTLLSKAIYKKPEPAIAASVDKS